MNKKAFTLIELLAVIILIGLISVITIPKITKSVSESKEKITGTSALSYTRQITKLILEEKIKNNNITLNGTYNIDSNGNIYNETNEYVINASGEKPKNGTLIFNENELQSACISINNYAVTIEDDEVTNIEKRDCEYQSR